MATVDVIVPAYNCAAYLEEAVASVLAQTVTDFVLVIVDDGSTDGTLALARSLAARNGRIAVLTQENSGGPAAPRNLGIRHSTGEIVAFLDPDDYWYPDKLARHAEIYARWPEVDIVFGDADVIDETGRRRGRFLGDIDYLAQARPHLEQVAADTFIGRESFYGFVSSRTIGAQPSGVSVRRSALERQDMLFPTDLQMGEDIDLWFRLMLKGKAAFIDTPLHAYRQWEGSLMTNAMRRTAGLVDAHGRNYQRGRSLLTASERRRYRRRLSRDCCDLAYLHRQTGDVTRARAVSIDSFLWRPNLSAVVSYMKSMVPPAVVAKLRRLRSAAK